MMKRIVIGAFLLAALPLLAADNMPAGANPMVSKLVDHWKTSKKFTLAVAAQMPAEDYGFQIENKLKPPQMTFGQQMNHIAGANTFFFGKMTGTKAPEIDGNKSDKESVKANLTTSFDYVIATLQTLTDDKLMTVVDTGDGKMTMLEGIMLGLDHTTNHRASSEMYLRAKGIIPTEYAF